MPVVGEFRAPGRTVRWQGQSLCRGFEPIPCHASVKHRFPRFFLLVLRLSEAA